MPYASKLKAVVKIFPSGAELSEVPISIIPKSQEPSTHLPRLYCILPNFDLSISTIRTAQPICPWYLSRAEKDILKDKFLKVI